MGDSQSPMGDPAINGEAPQRPNVAWREPEPPLLANENTWQQVTGAPHDEGGVVPTDFKLIVEPLPLLTRLTYALPALSTTSLTILISLYVNDFYVSLGTSLAFLSFFTALARSFDVITDPLMGWVSDTTVSKFGIQGRRRPYMRVGSIFYGIFFTALFWAPPFWPNTPGSEKVYAEGGDYSYGSNVGGYNPQVGESNSVAGYWFGLFYVLFYLSDTFTNVPYEALGPELHSDTEERAKLFFTQKLVNMMGMIFAAISPPVIALMWRRTSYEEYLVDCDYIFHSDSNETHILHGTKVDQLLYIDDNGPGITINKTAEFCESGAGSFCFEKLFANGTHYWFEQSIKTIEETCTGVPGNTTLPLDRYETSGIGSQQLGFIITAIAFGIYHFLVMQNLVHKTKERPSEQKETLPLVSSIMRSLNNGAFRPLLGAWACDGLMLAALVTMFPFYIRYVIQPEGLAAQEAGMDMAAEICMALFVIILLVSAMIGSVGWLWLAKRIGKFGAWQAMNFVGAATNLTFFFIGEGQSYRVLAAGALNGVPVGGQFLVNTIMSDVIDYDEFLNGSRSEGAFSVFATLIPKFVAIPASAIPLALINVLGFIQPVAGVAQNQPSRVENFIEVSFVMFPFTCAVLSFLLKFFYPIKSDKTAKLVQDGIAEFKRKYEAASLTGTSRSVMAYDPVIGQPVEQRQFTPEDEKQAVLMEMYTEKTLSFYVRELEKVAVGDTWRGGDTPPVSFSRLVRRGMFIYGLLTVAALAATAGSFQLLEDQTTSIFPIIFCIIFGFMLSLFGVATLRWVSARELQQYQLRRHLAPPSSKVKPFEDPANSSAPPGDSTADSNIAVEGGDTQRSALDRMYSQHPSRPLDDHIRVLHKVITLKKRGAAGGRHADIRESAAAAEVTNKRIGLRRRVQMSGQSIVSSIRGMRGAVSTVNEEHIGSRAGV